MGYHKMTLNEGLNLVGPQFVAVGATSADLQSFIDAELETDNQILFYTGSGYEIYTYDSEITFDKDDNELGAGWSDSDGYRAERNVDAAEGFWLRVAGSTPVTFSGEVSENSVKVKTNGGLQLVSLPLPVEISMNDVEFEGLDTGDELLLYTGSGYEVYTYDAEITFDHDDNELGAGWSDPEGYRAEKKLGINQGFWLRAAGDEVTISVK